MEPFIPTKRNGLLVHGPILELKCELSLAAGAAGNVLALAASLTARDTDAAPSPVGAGTGSAQNIDIGGAAVN